jgi:hypothetical protein
VVLAAGRFITGHTTGWSFDVVNQSIFDSKMLSHICLNDALNYRFRKQWTFDCQRNRSVRKRGLKPKTLCKHGKTDVSEWPLSHSARASLKAPKEFVHVQGENSIWLWQIKNGAPMNPQKESCSRIDQSNSILGAKNLQRYAYRMAKVS